MFIPITLLIGLTLLPLGSFGDNRAATFVPVIMALAVISTAFTGQAIAVAFDRRYGALKRLGATALPVWGIIAGKSAAVVTVVFLQSIILGAIGFALGWRPPVAGLALGAAVIALGTAVFAALGLPGSPGSSSLATLALPPSNSSPPSEPMSVSSPDCGSMPIFCPRTTPATGPRTPPGQGQAPPNSARCCTCERVWRRHTVRLWYSRPIASSRSPKALPSGTVPATPVPIRWLLVRDPRGELAPQAFLCTDLDAAPVDILQWFVSRWQLEVTFQETRAHLGVETQRQWSDLAIIRTTPALLGLFSLVTLWAHDLAVDRRSLPQPPPGTTSRTAPSAMPSPRCAARSGIIRFVASPAATAMLSKSHASSGNAPKTPSPMPLSSIKSS